MKAGFFLLSVVLTVSGCHHRHTVPPMDANFVNTDDDNVSKFMLPDGSYAYHINCSSSEMCEYLAEKTCPKGYRYTVAGERNWHNTNETIQCGVSEDSSLQRNF